MALFGLRDEDRIKQLLTYRQKVNEKKARNNNITETRSIKGRVLYCISFVSFLNILASLIFAGKYDILETVILREGKKET